MKKRASALIPDFKVKTASSSSPIAALSGGNLQRAVLARELTGDVDLLIVSNPCFGLDVRHRGVRHGRRVRQQRRTSEGCPFRKADTAEFSSQFRQIFR